MYLQIGLMRPGILLACPQTLMSLHGLSTLEDVFLKLCMKDREPVRPRWSHFVWLSVGTRLIWNWKLIWNRRTGSECRPCLQLHGRVRVLNAQLQVLTIQRQRHSGPGKWNLQLLRGTIALYGNMEMARHWPDIYWRFYQLRAQVLDWVDWWTNESQSQQVPFHNLDDAVEATRRGEVWGVIHIPQNFTEKLMSRQKFSITADNAAINGSQIGVRLDWSSK